MKLACLAGVCIALVVNQAWGQKPVTCPLLHGPGQIQADLYGQGTRGILLAHGGRFHKESWKRQAQTLAGAGFLVVAVGFRGDSLNPDGSPGSFGTDAENAEDVLAAVAYLRGIGAKTVSAVGASLGGDAVGQADAKSKPGAFDRIVLLASSGGDTPEKLSGRKLFIVARDDRSSDGLRLPEISRHYARAPEPKKLVVLDGSAHAQFLFETDQGQRLMDEILRFVAEP
jgi:dienelactone hydrolase